MSMARSFEQDQRTRDPREPPSSGHKSLENSSSAEMMQAAKKETIVEETEDELAATEAVVNHREPKPKDEGLGESFDQQSEMSDSGTSLNSRGPLQNKGSLKGRAYDVLEEEGQGGVGEEMPSPSGSGLQNPLSASTPAESHEDIITEDPENNHNSNNSAEITLDPARLASGNTARLWRKAFVPGDNSGADKLRSRSRISRNK